MTWEQRTVSNSVGGSSCCGGPPYSTPHRESPNNGLTTMDTNTILLIAFGVMMLFCCGDLGRLYSRGGSKVGPLDGGRNHPADVVTDV